MDRRPFELLAPAGDLEKLKTAVHYGADAVYFGGEQFSLRAGAGNLTVADMAEGIDYAHARGRRCYLTLNIYAHHADLAPLTAYLRQVRGLGLDGYIVSDPGVATLVREEIPEAALHLSTQANVTNHRAATFWYRQGVKRLVLARELSLEEIREIRSHVPAEMELEAFVHGAMCISYSGRCLLSNFMAGRDANRGLCAHPCRWHYALVEEKRPGEYYPVEEDGRGTYLLNSRDLCMLPHLPALIESGVNCAKIEGRMKSVFYVATVVNAYRQAIDAYLADPAGYQTDPALLEEVSKVSHRTFTTGFYLHPATGADQNYETSDYTRTYVFVGVVLAYDRDTGFATVEQRNKLSVGEEIEVFGPGRPFFLQRITALYDAESGAPLETAPHPQQRIRIPLDHPAAPGDLLRRKREGGTSHVI